jgi:enoyl-CoA hydratase/carnithine racemase
MTDQPVVLKRENGVVVLTLNNPPLNVTTLETTRALDALVSQLADDPTVRVTVLTGSGERAFCAGSDIKELPAVADAVIEKKLGRENAVFSRTGHATRCPVATHGARHRAISRRLAPAR